MTRTVILAIALLTLTCCESTPFESAVRMVDDQPWQVGTQPAGKDCDVLLVESGMILDASLVESMHYGTGPWRTHPGGLYRYSRNHGYRGVAYRDSSGKTWNYGALSDDEAKSLIACAGGKRRALLIGIDDYTASRLGAPPYEEGERDWSNLRGAVNDVEILEKHLREFDVVTLKNQNATREAILDALNDLAGKSAPNDIVFFYFAGHGSQVVNSKSAEPDRMDEAIVPADSRTGVPDIRDKELRTSFNRILDRGARLTVMLDNCHSASGARGRSVRGIAPDGRDVADPQSGGPAPESRGALVITSVQDDEIADEIDGEDGKRHGAFTWAWIRAMREARRNEPAVETFLRAQARLRAEKPFQTPALSGNAGARLTPFLGDRRGRHRTVVAVEKVRRDGTVVLQGGLAHGLMPGSELPTGDGRLTITSVEGVTRSEAKSEGTIHAGAIVETTGGMQHWHDLASQSPSPFRLALRRERDGGFTSTGPVKGGERYTLVLRATTGDIPRRYVYVFVIDSAGKSSLLYPRHGSVENRHAAGTALADSTFTITPPYGLDTYFLLTTDQPLPNPWMLGWDDVRAAALITAGSWSLDKIAIESVP